MAKVMIAAGLTLLLAGCNGGVTVAQNTNSATTASTGEPPSGAKMPDASTASGGSNDCSKNPSFAPVYADGKIIVCSSVHFGNTGKDSGGFSYTTGAPPAAVLAFSKESAEKSGFAVRISNATMLSAADGDIRRFVVLASAEGSGSRVQVNWTNTP